jgi:hypothetical protein
MLISKDHIRTWRLHGHRHGQWYWHRHRHRDTDTDTEVERDTVSDIDMEMDKDIHMDNLLQNKSAESVKLTIILEIAFWAFFLCLKFKNNRFSVLDIL